MRQLFLTSISALVFLTGASLKGDDKAYEFVTEKSFMDSPYFEAMANVATMEQVESGDKSLTIAEVLDKLKQELAKRETSPFSAPFREMFSEAEIEVLAEINANPAYQKYIKEVFVISGKVMEEFHKLILDTIENHDKAIQDSVAFAGTVEKDVFFKLSKKEWAPAFQSTQWVEMMTGVIAQQLGKEKPSVEQIKALHARIESDEMAEKIASVYRDAFSEKEAEDLLSFEEKSEYQKFSAKFPEILMKEVKIFHEVVQEILNQHGVAKLKEEPKVSSLSVLTDETFRAELCEKNKPSVLIISMKKCGPCQALKPVMEELALEYQENCRFFQTDGPSNVAVMKEFEVQMFPTVIFFDKDGVAIEKKIGFFDKTVFEAKIKTLIGNQ